MCVLVALSQVEELSLLRWGWQFARSLERPLRVVCLSRSVQPAEPETLTPEQAAELDNALLNGVAALLEELGPLPEQGEVTLVRARHPDAAQAVLAQITEAGAELLVVSRHHQGSERWTGNLDRTLLRRAPCRTLVLRTSGKSGQSCRSVVVLSAGGENGAEALRFGASLASGKCTTRAVFAVEAAMGDDAEELARRRLEKWRAEADVQEHPHVYGETFVGRTKLDPLLDDTDLLLLGEGPEQLLQDAVLASLEARIAKGEHGCAVGVLRPAKPIHERAYHAAQQRLRSFLPHLSRDERLALFENLQRGSGWSVDFATLIGLSTALASLGLMQDSGAVVIGAMLVAPLMTPMIGAGLSLVQGNSLLARRSVRAILLGFFLALCISVLLGLIVPSHALTDQLRARGTPTLLDLAVALFSGMAAAYALARPGLTGALPGVAIAAALVPPISTTGICLARGYYALGQGAALLFATNLVAIILGAALTFRIAGVVGKSEGQRVALWVKRTLLALGLAAVVLALPLGFYFYAQLRSEGMPRIVVSGAMEIELEQRLADRSWQVTFIDLAVRQLGASQQLELVVASPEVLSDARAAELAGLTREVVGAEAPVKVTSLLAGWQTTLQ